MTRAAHLATINRQLHAMPTKLAVIDRAAAGLSYSEISEALGVPRGVVSGIVYRARRAGSSFPRTKSNTPPPPEKPRAYKAYAGATGEEVADICLSRCERRETALITPTADWFPKRVDIMGLRGSSCRWPLWTGSAAFKDKFYCGLESEPGRPYCAHCYAISIAPRQTKQLDKRLGIDKARASA